MNMEVIGEDQSLTGFIGSLKVLEFWKKIPGPRKSLKRS